MERITEIFVVLENRPSTLGDLCGCLSESGINIEAIGLFQDTAKLYVKNVNKAMKVLSKYNYEAELRDVLRVDLENKPGALTEVATLLGNGTLSKKASSASVILDVSDIDRALKILKT
jgi:hypothetical protein